MRSLSDIEASAYDVLAKHGSWCPGIGFENDAHQPTAARNRLFLDAMKALVRKKYAYVEMTDDGPRYHAA